MMPQPETARPGSIPELADLVRQSPRLQLVGAASKSAMSAPRQGALRCEMTALSGVVDHQPTEFLLTALAGTPIAQLQQVLADTGQYFPFDPPLVEAGATIGGTVAAGLSGPGRLRHGGIRDFIMGIRFVDGLGCVVSGGGRVVKNAAGFDLPKLLVGSCGYLGAIVELTLKVFPAPEVERTVRISTSGLAQGLKIQTALVRTSIQWTAIDLASDGTIDLRIGGPAAAVEALTKRTEAIVAQLDSSASSQPLEDADDIGRRLCDGTWAEAPDRLVRVPVAPAMLQALDHSLAETSVRRQYSAAGNLAWIRWPAPRPLEQLDELLRHHRLGGSVILGEAACYRLGQRGDAAMMARVKRAIDPQDKFFGFP